MKSLFILATLFGSLACNAQWYGYGAALNQLQDEDTDYFFAPMWQDSTVLNEYSSGNGAIWIYGLGQVLDPKSQIFEFLDESNLSEDQPYMVDSLAFPYNYVRFQNEAPDTLIIQFFKEENLTLLEQAWPNWEGNEDQSRARLDYDTTLLRAPMPFLEITELLDEDDVTEEGEIRWKFYAIEEFVNPGEVIATTLTYKAGNPYSFGDTLSLNNSEADVIVNLRNQFVTRYYRDQQRNIFPGEYNHAFIASRAARYSDNTNGWANQYWVGNGTNSGFIQADIQFHLSPMVGIEEISENKSPTLFPNPVNDRLNFSIDQAGTLSEIQILSLDGRVASYVDLDAYFNQNSISLGHLSAGTYYLKLVQNNRTYALPFIKE